MRDTEHRLSSWSPSSEVRGKVSNKEYNCQPVFTAILGGKNFLRVGCVSAFNARSHLRKKKYSKYHKK